jgi:uncharacterized protein (TIGR04255 family)
MRDVSESLEKGQKYIRAVAGHIVFNRHSFTVHPCVLAFALSLPKEYNSLMPEHEVFSNPVVKQVNFEIRFPNLFFIEGKIGDFQVQVIKDFPNSELVHRRSFMLFAGKPESLTDLTKQQLGETVDKIWQFKSLRGTTLEISSKNLVLTSEQHHSYKYGAEKSFRATIETVTKPFFDMVQLPSVLRVGFRYVNECPILERSTDKFKECYDSILPLNRFRLEDAESMDCAVVINRKPIQYRRLESLRLSPNECKLILDLDAWTENVPTEQVMAATDGLYDVISGEFKETVKAPIIEYMRKPKEQK